MNTKGSKTASPAEHKRAVTPLHVFAAFFRIGITTFGGGYAMIAMMEREAVARLGWLDKQEYLDMVALSQSLPGALAVNLSAMAGSRLNQRWGAWLAYAGVVTPSLLIIYLIARFFEPYMDSPMVRAMFSGMNPAIIGLMAASVYQLWRSIKPVPLNIALGAFGLAAVSVLGWHPLLMILIAGGAGFFLKGRMNA